MSPQAQILLTGTIEVLIALALGGCAYWNWKRRNASQAGATANAAAPPPDAEQVQNSRLMNELARLVVEHTRSVELFQKFIETSVARTSSPREATASLARQIQLMRDANHRFDECADGKTAELSMAAGRYPDLFGDVSATFVDHRRRTCTFDDALELVPPEGTADDVHQLTSASLRDVFETRDRLEKELASAKRQIEQQAARLRAAELDARIDPLTRLANRRAFDEHLETVHSLFDRSGVTYSILVLDIDRFKSFNDTHGHAAGDSVLQVLAKVLQMQLRLSDRPFRLGGEEFVLILSATGLRQAAIVAERLRKRVEAAVVHIEGKALHFTASIGVAEIEGGQSSGELMERADEALYAAKESGRNRVEIAPSLNAPAAGEEHQEISS